jgi:hypothetical protein
MDETQNAEEKWEGIIEMVRRRRTLFVRTENKEMVGKDK